MANYYLDNEMERRRLAERNDSGRGNHNAGMFQSYGSSSSLTSGDRVVSGTSYKKASSGGHYLGNGQYVED